MKKSLFLAAVLLFAISGFANTTYNNFNGFDSDYWNPFGYPDTATYGEIFTAPNSADNNLASFSFWFAGAVNPGNIILGATLPPGTAPRPARCCTPAPWWTTGTSVRITLFSTLAV